ncbi:MAG: zinc-binding dehydrogenase [Gammaproteobacteria bacterium]
MSAYITARKLRPAIDKVFPVGQCEDALKLMASGDFVGKIVLRL